MPGLAARWGQSCWVRAAWAICWGPRRAFATEQQVLAGGVPGFGQAKSCILVYLQGGPPHIDMWDMKPNAAAEIRGPFKPIATSLPGLQICEHMPTLARQAHRYALLRSVTHPNDLHVDMVYYTLTGKELGKPEANDAMPTPPSRSDHPHIGSIVSRFKPRELPLPGFVAIPGLTLRMMAPISPGSNGGIYGRPVRSAGDQRRPARRRLPPGDELARGIHGGAVFRSARSAGHHQRKRPSHAECSGLRRSTGRRHAAVGHPHDQGHV